MEAHLFGDTPDMGEMLATAPAWPTGARRLAHIVGAVTVFAVVPALVMAALVGEVGVAASLPGALGAVGAKLGGTRGCSTSLRDLPGGGTRRDQRL